MHIDGIWTEVDGKDVFTPNPNTSRHNGTIIHVDRSDREATVKFQDHPYADKAEPKIRRYDFDSFYDRWDESKSAFVFPDV